MNGGAVSLGVFGNAGGSGQFVNDLTINTSPGGVGGTAGNLTLNGNISLDFNVGTDTGDLEFLSGGNVIVAAALVAIDTEDAGNADGGSIDLGNGTIDGNSVNRRLTLNASGSANGGSITFGLVGRDAVDGGGQFLGAFGATTNGTGLVRLDSNITVDNAANGLAVADAGVMLSGRVELNAPNAATPIVIHTQDADNNNSGFVNLSTATVFAVNAGDDLTIDTSSTGGLNAGDVRLSVFDTAAGAAFVHQLNVIADNDGAGGMAGRLFLHGNILLDDDGAGVASVFNVADNGGNIVLATNVTIDTEQGNTASVAGGAVDFGTSAVTGDSTVGRDLMINTLTTGVGAAADGGDVTLASFVDADGVSLVNRFVHQVTINTGSTNGTAGRLFLTGTIIQLDDDGATASLFDLNGNGNVVVAVGTADGLVTIDTENGVNANGGAIDLGDGTIDGNVANRRLTLNTSGAVNGGNITFGLVDKDAVNGGGQFLGALYAPQLTAPA